MEEKKQDEVVIKEQPDLSTNENYIKLSIDEYKNLIQENAMLKKDIEFKENSSIKVVSHSNENKQENKQEKRRLF